MRYTVLATGLLGLVATFVPVFRQRAPFRPPRPSPTTTESPPPMDLEWASRPEDIDRHRAIARTQSIDARARTLNGDWSWLDTAAQLQDPFFVVDQRHECDTEYGATIEGRCWYSFHYVLSKVDDDNGRVVYVRADLRDPHSTPPADEANDPGCHDYVGCLARARLGATLPLPALLPAGTTDTEVGIHEHMQSSWGVPSLYDPNQLPGLIDSWTRSRRHLDELDAAGKIVEPEVALRHRFATSVAPYMRQHLRRILDQERETSQ